MDPQLKSQLKQIVAVAPSGSVDLAGQVQPGTTATYYARIEPSYREVSVSGVVERTSHMVILSEDFDLTERQAVEATLWLPTDDLTAEGRRVKIAHPCYDDRGRLSHWELRV